jgi:hypothetical protein
MTEQSSSAEKTREYYRRQGEAREQQRILTILEDLSIQTWMNLSKNTLINLIKGASK